MKTSCASSTKAKPCRRLPMRLVVTGRPSQENSRATGAPRAYLTSTTALRLLRIATRNADGAFDQFIGGYKASFRLRHKDKKRKGRHDKKHGKIKISHETSERPRAADERARLGDWEEDTIAVQREDRALSHWSTG